MADEIREADDRDDEAEDDGDGESAEDSPVVVNMSASDFIASQKNDDDAELTCLGHAISVVRTHMPGVIYMEEASFKDQGIFPTLDHLDDDLKAPFKRMLINAMNFAASCFEVDGRNAREGDDHGDRRSGGRGEFDDID